MAKDVNDLLQKRAKLVKEQRALLDKAEAEKRELSADENTNYENMDAEFDKLDKEIEREERTQKREKELALEKKDDAKPVVDPDKPEARKVLRETDEYRKAFSRYLRGGLMALTPAEREIAEKEVRALQSDADIQGGYLVTPMQMVQTIIKALDDSVHIRRLATKFQVPNAQSLGAPSLDADPDDFDWTTELATGSEDSAMAFGRRELTPHPLAKLIKISNKLLRQVPDVESFVRGRLEYKLGVTQEKAFLTGTGAQQPLGVFVASTDGIPTARDVSTDNTTSAITADGLINALYSLKEGYQQRAEWLFHRDTVKMIRKLKDGEGQYLWRPGISGGQPSTILDKAFMMSEFAPNTFTTGLYVGIVGDFSFYWIADALDMTMQRLVELYAATNQVGLIGRLESDGMPVLGEAFARVKLA